MRRVVTIVLAVLAAMALCVAGLVALDSPPRGDAASDGSLDFAGAIAVSYDDLPELEPYPTRSGVPLRFRRYDGGEGSSADRLIVLAHGSGWHGMQFHAMAGELARRGLGTVVVPDLRGHGPAPERRGDVDYIGQLEDDLADLIGFMKDRRGYGEVVLGGHSSGGGLVVRFAGGAHGALADRFVLLAPFLKYDAPTTRPNSGGWAHPATGRIVGLTMLNTLGITAFNHLPVISFAMPRQVVDGPYGNTATTRYSFRLNQSFAPRPDYRGDLARMVQPFLLLAGAKDEAFFADRYEEVISAATSSGRYVLLPGIDHIGVTLDPAAIDAVADWIGGGR